MAGMAASNFRGGDVENGWSDQSELALEAWARHAQKLRDMHLHAASHYTTYNQRLSIPFLVVGAMASFGTGGNIFENAMWLSVFSFVMTLAATVLGSVSNFLDYGRLSEKHHQCANGYSSFARDISTTMLFHRSARQPLRDLVKELRVKYEEITDRAPLLPIEVEKGERHERGMPNEMRLSMNSLDRPLDRARNSSLPFARLAQAPSPVLSGRSTALPDRSLGSRRVRRRSLGDASCNSLGKEPFQRVCRSVVVHPRETGGHRITLPPLTPLHAERDGDQGAAAVAPQEDPEGVSSTV